MRAPLLLLARLRDRGHPFVYREVDLAGQPALLDPVGPFRRVIVGAGSGAIGSEREAAWPLQETIETARNRSFGGSPAPTPSSWVSRRAASPDTGTCASRPDAGHLGGARCLRRPGGRTPSALSSCRRRADPPTRIHRPRHGAHSDRDRRGACGRAPLSRPTHGYRIRCVPRDTMQLFGKSAVLERPGNPEIANPSGSPSELRDCQPGLGPSIGVGRDLGGVPGATPHLPATSRDPSNPSLMPTRKHDGTQDRSRVSSNRSQTESAYPLLHALHPHGLLRGLVHRLHAQPPARGSSARPARRQTPKTTSFFCSPKDPHLTPAPSEAGGARPATVGRAVRRMNERVGRIGVVGRGCARATGEPRRDRPGARSAPLRRSAACGREECLRQWRRARSNSELSHPSRGDALPSADGASSVVGAARTAARAPVLSRRPWSAFRRPDAPAPGPGRRTC